ncbi:MAG TPA: hypothetical protein VFS21_20105 [Roseiflexaceae bacterium]|nr:hypothetical protein [Roseiflexaceae bacterium]
MRMDDFPDCPSESASAQMPHYPGLEQLMAAALANPEFAARLLADPARALLNNIYGVTLSQVELDLASAIRNAVDIHDYATRLREHIRRQHGL